MDADAPCVSSPTSVEQELWSYDRIHHAVAKVYDPHDDDELATLLRTLSSAEPARRVTFRAGGQAIDGQAIGRDVVIQLDAQRMARIGEPACDARGYYVTVGAAATWGAILEKTAAYGLVPYSVVTTSHATIGGTVAADCLSRSSPISGREGQHVRSFKMRTASGCAIECRRDDPDPAKRALFRAVIGGLGYLGVLTEITIDLRPPLPSYRPGQRIRVATTVDKYVVGHFGGPWSRFLPGLREKTARREIADARGGVLGAIFGSRCSEGEPEMVTWDAVSSAAWYALCHVEALLFRSRYVLDREVDPMPLYQPASRFFQIAATCMCDPALTEIAESAAFAMYRSGVYVDELADFMFFMENQFTPVKEAADAHGYRLNTVQQTFVIPADPARDDPQGVRLTERFLEAIRPAVLGDASFPAMLDAMRPALIDVLYLPEDEFLLSACRGQGGYAVTLTFTDRNGETWDTLKEKLRELSETCATLGGRVHLVKNVEADQPLLERMYRDAFAEFRALKQRYDPRGMLENDLYNRIFGA